MKQILRSNNEYPRNFVECCRKMYLPKVYIKHLFICIVPKEGLVCVFPYLGKKLLEIKKCLQNVIDITLPYGKLKVIFKPPSKIVNHFHLKDMVPKKRCSRIFYSFKCASGNAIYYGKTNRHLYIRSAEHMEISHLTNKLLKHVKQSAISDHLLIGDCNINLSDNTILSKYSINFNY